MTLKVLLIAPQPFFLHRGTPLNVRAMATCLAELGYEVDLLVFPSGEDIQIPGVRIIRSSSFCGLKEVPIGPSWRKILLDFLLCFKAAKLVWLNKYSVIHGVEEAGFIAFCLGKLLSIPSVFDSDSCMLTQLSDTGFIRSKLILNILGKVEAFCMRRVSAVITVCQSLTEKVQQINPAGLVYQIEDFPLELPEVNPQRSEKLRQELELSDEAVILYTGNLEPYQGIDLLLESFAQIPAKLNAVLICVGGKMEQRDRLASRSRALGVANRTRLLAPKPVSEMADYMDIASLLASPRLHGTNTPLKLYTYMQSGKPILATNILSHTQVLDDSTAYLTKPTIADMALALARALEDSVSNGNAKSKSAKAADLVEAKFSRTNFKRKLSELYAQLVGQPVSAPSIERSSELPKSEVI